MIIVGVDPGARETGLVEITRSRLIRALVVNRTGDDWDKYLSSLYDSLNDLGRMADLIAVEDMKTPNPHLGMINPAGAMAASQVLGMVRMWCHQNGRRCLVVDPARNGSKPLSFYPAELVGAREKRGGGVLRHCRSAWDVALTAELISAAERKAG